jgi:lipopolysaccharide export system protein LptA
VNDEKIIMSENVVLKNQMSMINGNKLILDINSGKIEIFDDKLDQERVKGVLVDQGNKKE